MVNRPTFDANKYLGQWVAFRQNCEEVVGHGATLDAAAQDARRAGVDDPEFYRVPMSEAYFVGAA